MSSMDIHSKHRWDGSKGTCPTYETRFTLPKEHACHQEAGKLITKDAILDLRILLGTCSTVDQFLGAV